MVYFWPRSYFTVVGNDLKTFWTIRQIPPTRHFADISIVGLRVLVSLKLAENVGRGN